MSGQERQLTPAPGQADVNPALDLPDAQARQTAQRQHQQERLARLFRHGSASAEDRYLLELLLRYRGV